MGKLIVQSQVYGKTKYTAKVCNLVIENITFSYLVSHIGIILGDVMDFFQIVLHLVVFSISFSLIFLKYKQKSTRDKLPPGKKGWPIIGETLEFARIGQKGTPEMFIKDKMREYSQDLFKTSMFGENMVVCCSAPGDKFLFSDQVALSPESVENCPRRLVIVQYLKPKALHYFIPIMDSMAKEHLEADWSPNKQVKVLPLTMKYTFSLACRLFLSVTDHKWFTVCACKYPRHSIQPCH